MGSCTVCFPSFWWPKHLFATSRRGAADGHPLLTGIRTALPYAARCLQHGVSAQRDCQVAAGAPQGYRWDEPEGSVCRFPNAYTERRKTHCLTSSMKSLKCSVKSGGKGDVTWASTLCSSLGQAPCRLHPIVLYGEINDRTVEPSKWKRRPRSSNSTSNRTYPAPSLNNIPHPHLQPQMKHQKWPILTIPKEVWWEVRLTKAIFQAAAKVTRWTTKPKGSKISYSLWKSWP